jgi:hypothetical protein
VVEKAEEGAPMRFIEVSQRASSPSHEPVAHDARG